MTAPADRITLEIIRRIVAEMRAQATGPRGGQTVGERRMPVPLSVILELERALGPATGEYAAGCYAELTGRVERLERALRGLCALQVALVQFDYLDRGIGAHTPAGKAWAAARAALEVEGK
jgi:hypothetical protein